MHNWNHCLKRAEKHQLYRAVILARVNPDYRMMYPAEARNSENITQTKMNIEAVKRIEHDHQVRKKLSLVPIVDRPKRLNRNV